MEKIVEYAEKFNFKAFQVNLGILGLFVLKLLWELLSNLKHLKVGTFLEFLAVLASVAVGGVVVLATVHMLLWCACDYYKKNGGSVAAATASTSPAPTAAPAEEKKEEAKEEDKGE